MPFPLLLLPVLAVVGGRYAWHKGREKEQQEVNAVVVPKITTQVVEPIIKDSTKYIAVAVVAAYLATRKKGK